MNRTENGDHAAGLVAVSDLDAATPSKDERLRELHAFFVQQYEVEPKFFVKVPGRYLYSMWSLCGVVSSSEDSFQSQHHW